MSPAVRDMLIAAFAFAVTVIGIKSMPRIPSHEIVFFRALISLLICLYALLRDRVPLAGKNPPILLLRGISGTIALIIYFYSIQHMPMATAVTLQYLSPIFAVIIGRLWLKEKLQPLQILAFAISFVGVIFIKGFDARIETWLLCFAILSAFSSGVAYNCVRRLDNEHPLVVVIYFPLVTVPIVGIYTIFHWVTPTLWESFLLLYVGVMTQIAQVYMTRAYQAAPVSEVSIYSYMGVVYAVIFGVIFFGEWVPWGSLFGIALVILGLLVSHRISLSHRRLLAETVDAHPPRN